MLSAGQEGAILQKAGPGDWPRVSTRVGKGSSSHPCWKLGLDKGWVWEGRGEERDISDPLPSMPLQPDGTRVSAFPAPSNS